MQWREFVFFIKSTERAEMGNKEGKVVLTEEVVENISRSSGIETHKIRAECQNFLKDHPRGNMNRRDFRKFLKIALPKIDVKKMEENLFRMYDTNMDGIISMQEFLIVYHIFSEGTPEGEVHYIFFRKNSGLVQSPIPKKRPKKRTKNPLFLDLSRLFPIKV